MNIQFNFDPITTSDIILMVSIFLTSVFSFLVWRATVSANKTAKAIKEAGEKEKKAIENQNRFLVTYNLMQIENILLNHTIERGFKKNARKDIEEAIQQIKSQDLSLYFDTVEIKNILDFINYIEEDFLKVFKRAKVFSVNPLYANEKGFETIRKERQEYNRKESPFVLKAIKELEKLKDQLKS